MNLAVADNRHRLGRFLMTCVGLGLLMSVALAMVGIYQGVVAEALALSRSLNAHLWVVEEGTQGPFAEASRVPGDVREIVLRLPGVSDAGAVTLQTLQADTRAGRQRLQMIGYEPGRPGGPNTLSAGRMLGGARFEAVVDERAWLRVGDTVEFAGDRFTIVGTARGLVSSGGDPPFFVHLRDSQRVQFRLSPPAARRQAAGGAQAAGTDSVNAVIARLHPGASADEVADTERRWKHLSALTDTEQSDLLTRHVVNRARVQLGMSTVNLLLVSAVIVALIICTMTMDKLCEIATLKLIGAPDRTIVGLVLQQALLLGGVGFAIGLGVVFAVRGNFPRSVDLGPEEILFMAGVMGVICVLGSLVAIRAALKIEPQQALGG